MKKPREYTIPHTCKHVEHLIVDVKLPKAWLKNESNKPCPDCREVRRD